MSNRPSSNRPCTSCGQMCRSKDRVCMACRTGSTARYIDGEPIALTGGSWRPVRGVRRWVPDPDAEQAPTTDVTGLIACPTCRARVDQTCRTKSGHTTTPHGSRLAPRLCICGERLDRYRRLCDECQRLRTRSSKRDWAERNRAERKDAA